MGDLPFDTISKLISSLSPEDMQTMMEMSTSMTQGGRPSLNAENIAKLSGIVSKIGPENLQAMSKLAAQSGLLPQQKQQADGGAGTTTANAGLPPISQTQASMILMLVKAIHVISSAIVKAKKFLQTVQGRAFVVAAIALVMYYVMTRWFGFEFGVGNNNNIQAAAGAIGDAAKQNMQGDDQFYEES